MCGLVGFISRQSDKEALRSIQLMLKNIHHRGPDSQGIWQSNGKGLAMGHKRLSIMDLSPAGHQPMHSKSKRYVIVFNGEIYNHTDLKSNLPQTVDWSGHSDTEVLIEMIDQYGLKESLEKCTGMFAFALWDKKDEVLYLARDRVGEKPLYYGYLGQTFAFSSELAALYPHPDWQGTINYDALAHLFKQNNVPAPHAIFQNLHKLKPGQFLTLKKDQITIQNYWHPSTSLIHAQANPYTGSDQEAIQDLEKLIMQSLSGQMIADVPMGAFLSGGVDSSAVVALMQSIAKKPVKTFSIGFDQKAYNEAEHAKAVASHLGTDHTELYIGEKDIKEIIPNIPEIYSEPFADSSQLPTYLVSKLARQHVTVALSGDGGDELFSGYNRYLFANKLWPTMSRMPLFLKSMVSKSINGFSADFWNIVLRPLLSIMPQRFRLKNPGHSLYRLSQILAEKDLNSFYTNLNSYSMQFNQLVLAGSAHDIPYDELDQMDGLNDIRKMMHWDTQNYLPNDILVKVDRASMAVSLESRIPLLDHRIIEFAMSLPMNMLHRNGQSKWLLRQVLYRHIPRELIDRPKMGFGVPIGHWLKTDLKEWAGDLLSKSSLNADGILDADQINKIWQNHLCGKRDYSPLLWNILSFQAWRHHYKKYISI